MKTINNVKKRVLILFAGLMVACGAETIIVSVFIPAFAANWPVVGDDEYFIDLRPDDNDNSESGTFTGTEEHLSGDFRDGNPITGSFEGLTIEFTIARQNGDVVTYTGEMEPVSDTNHNIVRIELTSSEGDLVLGQ